MPKLPSLVFAIVCSLMLVLTQLLTFQQYKIAKEKQKNELMHEAAAVKDRFRNILVSDIAVAKTLAIIYKQYGVPAKFDSIASQILNNNPYAQALQITENGIVKNAYPDTLYKNTIGTNVNSDPLRKAEEAFAENRKDIYFGGPRQLRFGDTGIVGKVPILKDNKVIAVATVLTRLDIIKKAIAHTGVDQKKFAYQLIKVQKGESFPYTMSNVKADKESEYVDSEIPEGDWVMRTSYAQGYVVNRFPFLISGMGLLLSVVVSLLAYRRAREPYKLNKIIEVKTAQVNKANKELNLLNQINDIILDEDHIGRLFTRVCKCIVESGRYELAWIRNEKDVSAVEPTIILPFENGELCIHAKECTTIDENEVITLKRLVANMAIAVQHIQNRLELAESQSKFQNLVENFTVGVYIVQNEKIVYVNPRIVEEFGYAEHEIIDKQVEDFIYPGDMKLVRENIKERLATDGKASGRYEVRIVNKEGKPLWFEVLGGTTLYQGQPALIGTMVNITERKAIYADLEESKERYSNLFNFSPLPAWVADVDTLRFLDVNNAAVLHYGYSREEFLAMTLRDIRPAEDLEKMYSAVEEGLKHDGIFHVIMTHLKKNGELMEVEIQVAPIQYAGFKANMAIGTDITERQRYIHAIEAQNERLREISWIQSHHVRAPLSRIMGLIQTLADLSESTEEQQKVLDYLSISANELDEIVKAITAKSKTQDLLKPPGKT
ncbi:PAS domain S-box protein [Pedobacter insulae]|uniref:histidine kinase n=1 Tax=Pedobacter insulae TaxID=414048 RepID=A0A1I2ZSF5_9SPHI|nr:PAS domain S-box protein [Pedobacter insulae]SFH40021.1 PAS domain S-box-containing protein [Pedobacter insulae]